MQKTELVYILHMPDLDLQNLELGHVVYFTRHQNLEACCIFYTALIQQIYIFTCSTRSSKDWSLRHVVQLHMQNLDPLNLGTCCILYPSEHKTLKKGSPQHMSLILGSFCS